MPPPPHPLPGEVPARPLPHQNTRDYMILPQFHTISRNMMGQGARGRLAVVPPVAPPHVSPYLNMADQK